MTIALVRPNILYAWKGPSLFIAPDHRIPECVGGDARDAHATPGAYPHANTPQLWNSTVFPLLVHTMVGLQPLAPLEALIVAPDLPTWLSEVVLHDLRIGAATATIR